MNIWKIIKRFKYGQMWQLFILSVRYPLYVYPTLKATSKSFLKAKREFPDTHGGKGKGNAYRHAFWNSLICFECRKWSKNTRRILAWAKLITDKHEQLSPNHPLDRQMDLHNNKIGRNLYIASSFKSVDEMSNLIIEKLKSAKRIDSIEEAEQYPTNLVYIKDE